MPMRAMGLGRLAGKLRPFATLAGLEFFFAGTTRVAGFALLFASLSISHSI